MTWNIDAWLDQDGTPHLRIIDAEQQCVRLDWQYQDRQGSNDRKQLKQLFRQLLLLTCQQDFENLRLFSTVGPVANPRSDSSLISSQARRARNYPRGH